MLSPGALGHLPALHVADAPVRVEDHDIDVGEAAERLDRGCAGIAGRGADDRRVLAALLQGVVHEPREQLHRQVLEGQRRPMKQLEDEEIVVELRERRDGLVPEAGISGIDHRSERRRVEIVADERRQHRLGNRAVGLAGKARDRLA